MRIDIRQSDGHYLFSHEVDPKERPSKVVGPSENGPVVFFKWEQALDDRSRLRRCIVCGCPELFRDRQFPPLTWFVVMTAAAALVMSFIDVYQGYALMAWGLVLGLLIGDLLARSFASPSMACYQCGSVYRNAVIPRTIKPWDPAIAERYRKAPHILIEDSVDMPPDAADQPEERT